MRRLAVEDEEVHSNAQPTHFSPPPSPEERQRRTSIFAQGRHGLLPLFLAFLYVPVFPCRKDKSQKVGCVISLGYNQLETKKSFFFFLHGSGCMQHLTLQIITCAFLPQCALCWTYLGALDFCLVPFSLRSLSVAGSFSLQKRKAERNRYPKV